MHERRPLGRFLGLAAAALIPVSAGCPPGADSAADLGGADLAAGQATDMAVVQHSAADVAACESALAMQWQTQPPVVGLSSTSAIQSYAKVLGTLMANFSVPGGAVAVTRNGQLVLALGLGMADREEQQPAQPDSLFRLASLSKQLTSVAILKLVEAGKLGLDDKALPYLADLTPLPGRTVNPQLAQITIRNLLQHTGGWNRDKTFDPMFYSATIAAALGEPGPATCSDVIRYMLDQPLTYTPGTTYCYSNFGYCMLGRIIERVTSQKYEAQVQSSVLFPVGAARMRIGATLLTGRADGEVRYYDFPGAGLASSVFPGMTGQVPWPYGGWYLEAMDSHGGWLASPVDMLRYQLAIDGQPTPPDVIASGSRTQLLANPGVPSCTASGGTTPTDPSSWYGLGFSVNDSGNYWHTGSLDGTSTEDVIASNGFAWSAFFNTRPQNSDTFGSRLDQRLWDALGGAKDWSATDLFAQYGSLSAWMSEAAYRGLLDSATASGQYPAQLQGRQAGSGVELRVHFAPVPGAAKVQSAYGLDCIDYRARDAELAAQGYHAASLQSFRDGQGQRRYQLTWVAN